MVSGALGPREPGGDLFRQPWWLDAAAPNAWEEVTVTDRGRVRATLPFARSRLPFGAVKLGAPPLTPRLGPWTDVGEGDYQSRLGREEELLADLIALLPPHDYFSQLFNASFTNWLPFYWAGFDQTTRYSYVLDDLSDTANLWRGLRDGTRSTIKKASKTLVIKDDRDCDELLRLTDLTFARQGQANPIDQRALRRLYLASIERDAGRALFAVDCRGRAHAGLLLVWDPHCAYYLVSGSDPDLRTSGATSLLVWEAIILAATVTERFDFEGSMIKQLEFFFRGFGAQQQPYFQVSRASRRGEILLTLRQLGRSLRGRS